MPARSRTVRRRGRTWTVEEAEPDGYVQISGAEAAAYVGGCQTIDQVARRKALSGAEAARAGFGRMRRVFR